jgi:hypothetical protein
MTPLEIVSPPAPAEEKYVVQPVALPPAEELAKYDGLWVAVDSGRVVASGKTPRSVLQGAAARGLRIPLIFQVPLQSPGKAFY